MGARNLEWWLELLCRRWRLVFGIWLFVSGSVALGSILWPPSYDSIAKILVEADRAQLLVSPGLQENAANQPAVLVNSVSEQDINSEVELLSGRDLIELALSGVPLKADTGFVSSLLEPLTAVASFPDQVYSDIHGERRLGQREQWALKIEQHLSISVIKRSNVIEISFRSHDARWSREFLSRLLDRYLELHARLSQDPQAEKFFKVQEMLLRERLRQSEDVLTGLQLQTGISHVEEQRQALITQLYAAEADYRKTSAQLAATLEELASLQALIKKTPQRLAKEQKVVQNLALGQIKPQVLELEAERAELLSRYQPGSARITEIDAKLTAARNILERENHTEVQESTTDLNPTWTDLNSELDETKADADSLKASEEAQAKQLALMRTQLRSLTSDGLAIQRAQIQVDSDKEAYLSYVRKTEEARVSRSLNQNRILNVSVVEQPTLPLLPAFPKLGINLVAGLLFALVMAFGAAHWAEQHDPKLCSIAAVEESGIPIIAVVRHGL